MSAARLLLVRHGITDWNRAGRFQGHLDPPLADEGRAEAHRLAERLRSLPADERPRRVVASSLARASETGSIIAAGLGVALRSDPRLMEIGQGEWEGRSHDELERDDADRYAAWRADPAARPPGAEDVAMVDARTTAAIADAVAGPGATCLVTHGGVLRVIAAQLLELSVRGWDLDADNCSLGVVTREGDAPWQLERWNDVHHLLGTVTTHIDEDEGRPRAL